MKLIIPLIVVLIVSCQQRNKIHFKHNKIFLKNKEITENFGFYTNKGYFNIGDSTIDYLYLNNQKLIFIGENFQREILTEKNPREQIFSICSNGKDVFKLNSKGDLFQLSDSLFIKINNLNKGLKFLKKNFVVSPYFKSQNYFHIFKNCIIFPIISETHLFQSNPMFAIYNLKTKTTKLFSIHSTSDFYNYQYGSNNIFISYLKNDTLLIQYPFKSEITLFSVSKNKIIDEISPFYNQSNDKQELCTSTNNPEEFYRYNLENPTFGPLIYNPYKKHYYRFYRLKLERKNQNGEYTIEEDKKNTVLIYDSKFNYLGQYFLPKKYYLLNELTPSRNGFYLGTNFKINKYKLIFHEIQYD